MIISIVKNLIFNSKADLLVIDFFPFISTVVNIPGIPTNYTRIIVETPRSVSAIRTQMISTITTKLLQPAATLAYL